MRRFFRSDYPLAAALRYLDLKTYLPDNILVKVDRASMAVSLEVRPPLLDHRVVEFAFRIDDRLMMDHGAGKAILRASIAAAVPPRDAGPSQAGVQRSSAVLASERAGRQRHARP